MTVWTIESDEWAGGGDVARGLAHRAGVPLVAEQFLVALALELGTTVTAARAIEREATSPALRYALAVGAAMRPAPELVRRLEHYRDCRGVFERTANEAARGPCVIVGHGAYAILADRPGTQHVRLRAPLEWKTRRLADDACISPAAARRLIRADERLRRRRLRRVFGLDAGDLTPFDAVYDTSRLSPDAIVDALLALAGRAALPEVRASSAG
jgi:cytidylate kinase